MKCRNCGAEIDEKYVRANGIHRECICGACGRLHQWDVPMTARPGRIREGPPQECEHKNLKISGTLVPLP